MESLTANNHHSSPANFQHIISKLRWIGHDDEAELLLRTHGSDESGFIWPVEIETD